MATSKKNDNDQATDAPVDGSELLAAAQDAGHYGEDAAQKAGGIDKLREQHQAALSNELLPGETEPVYPPGHPNDPTVRTSTTTGR